MADKKISALTASTTPLAGTEVLPVVQSGTTTQVSVANLTAGRAVSALSLASTTGSNFATTSGSVGVGTASPSSNSKLHIFPAAGNAFEYINAVSGSSAGLEIAGNGNSVGSTSLFIGQGSDGKAYFYQRANIDLLIGTNNTTRITVASAGDVTVNTGNLVIGTSGKGIDFSATPGTGTSELFADYEEGEWSAIISDGTIDATMSATLCTYTKVGRQVTLTGYIATSLIVGITGPLRIKGLPFTAQGAAKFYAASVAGLGGSLNLTAGQSVSMLVEPGGAYLNLYRWATTGGTTSLYPAEWTNSGSIAINLTYFVA